MPNSIQPREHSKGGGTEGTLHVLCGTATATSTSRISTRTMVMLSSTGTTSTTTGTATTRVSATQIAHFSPAVAGEFCFESCPDQPPKFLPISSSFTESAIYLLSLIDFVSQMIMKSIFTASILRMARRIYGSFSCDDRKLAAATASIISMNNESIR